MSAQSQVNFVWNFRDQTVKRIRIQLNEDEQAIVSLDKSTSDNGLGDKDRVKLFRYDGCLYFYTVIITTEGTKVVQVTQELTN